MEKRISDLVSVLEPADIEMKNSNIVSADRIKEMTMKKIKQQPKARRVTKIGRIGLVAAILAMALGIGVGAVGAFVNYDKDSGESMLESFFGAKDTMSGERVVEYEALKYDGIMYKKLITNLPAWQRTPISADLVEKLSPHIGAVNESVSYDGYTLTVEACLYDANVGGGLLYYSVENPDGLEGFKVGELNGEITWPLESEWFVVLEQHGRSYIDAERSTETKIYVCTHFAYVEDWGDFVVRIGTGDERTERHSAGLNIQLYDTGMPALSFADEAVKLSHIGIWVDKPALGLPYSNDIDRIILRFSDGSEYVAELDDGYDYISNLAYALDRGSYGGASYLFNSVVDIENVVEVQIEDMVFKAE